MTLRTVPRVAPGVETAEIQGEVVILDASGRKVRGLNETAACLWRLVDSRRNVGEIADGLTAAFDVDHAEAQASALAFVGELISLGLLTATPA